MKIFPQVNQLGGAMKVKEPNRRFVYIAYKMMCGINKIKPTPKQIDAFQKRYESAITWVNNVMPNELAGKTTSVGVLGAVGKGVLWYGQEKMAPFCAALSNGHFNGVGDPAHILWLWLTGRSKYNSNIAYKKTVAAIRAYVVGKQLLRVRDGNIEVGHFAPAETDLFDWDSNFITMLKRQTNTSPKDFKVYGVEGPTAEEIRLAEEVEEAMKIMRKSKIHERQ